MSCLDPSLFHVPEESGVRLPFYFFTMSEPQAAHATSTRPLMPPDQEQVVNIIPFEGFSNAGCTLCEEAKCGGKWLRFKDCVGKQPTLGNYGIKHTLDALFLFSFSYTPTHSPTHKYNAYHTCCLVKQDLCCTCLGRIDYPCQMRTTWILFDKTITCSEMTLICGFARHNSDKEIWISCVMSGSKCKDESVRKVLSSYLPPTILKYLSCVSVNKKQHVNFKILHIYHCRRILESRQCAHRHCLFVCHYGDAVSWISEDSRLSFHTTLTCLVMLPSWYYR